MKNIFFIVILITFISNFTFSDNILLSNFTTNQIRDMLFWNNIVPGTAQIALGKTDEGVLYISALPLMITGSALAVYGLYSVNISRNNLFVNTNGLNYIYYNQDYNYNNNKWAILTGSFLLELGALLSSYSQYDATREMATRYNYYGDIQITNGFMSNSLWDYISAPWKAENIFNNDVLPVLPLLIAVSMSVTEWQRVGDYFTNSTVRFLNISMNPYASLGLVIATALLYNNLVAPFEELTSRANSLLTDGPILSSIVFGSSHLINMCAPNISVENTVIQSLFATFYGLYAAQKTIENKYDIQHMIAFHFWNNVIAMALNYMIDPGNGLYLSFNIPIRF